MSLIFIRMIHLLRFHYLIMWTEILTFRNTSNMRPLNSKSFKTMLKLCSDWLMARHRLSKTKEVKSMAVTGCSSWYHWSLSAIVRWRYQRVIPSDEFTCGTEAKRTFKSMSTYRHELTPEPPKLYELPLKFILFRIYTSLHRCQKYPWKIIAWDFGFLWIFFDHYEQNSLKTLLSR